jgi:arginyl-tRNA synthetase
VFYVQYAHARIASMFQKATPDRVRAAVAANADWGSSTLESSERDLIKRIVAFPEEVAEAAERRGPHRIVSYCLDLARDFTSFYEKCRVVGAETEAVESFRLAVSLAAQRTIASSLGLLGVSAPEAM